MEYPKLNNSLSFNDTNYNKMLVNENICKDTRNNDNNKCNNDNSNNNNGNNNNDNSNNNNGNNNNDNSNSNNNNNDNSNNNNGNNNNDNNDNNNNNNNDNNNNNNDNNNNNNDNNNHNITTNHKNITLEYYKTEKSMYKNFYCVNCNCHGHINKTCKTAIISNGIIAFHINFTNNLTISENDLIAKIGEAIKNEFKENNKPCTKNDYKTYNIYKNYAQKNIIKEKINENITFLMVQRKNSLGYIEFIRGKYNLSNLSSVINLFEQMIEAEIRDILNNDYHTLWLNLWQNDVNNEFKKNVVLSNEYKKSKEKFNTLKNCYINIILNSKPHFNFNEWGFPKGRRKPYESDLACGIREFEEETKQTEHTYQIIDNCIPIRENLVGTNDIFYIHNYYLANLKSNNLNFNITDDNIKEIGDIKLFNVNECLKLIKPYHYNKINIIKNIYEIINKTLMKYSQ